MTARKRNIISKKQKMKSILISILGIKNTTPPCTIWLVHGEKVREQLSQSFIAGGHGYAYEFIPRDQIWIDNNIKPEERNFIIEHELYEGNLMANKKYQHSEAHDAASVYEQ